MPDYFKEALGDFVNGFTWYGPIEHLLKNGYTIDRMIKEDHISLPPARIREFAEKINRIRVSEGKDPYPIIDK